MTQEQKTYEPQKGDEVICIDDEGTKGVTKGNAYRVAGRGSWHNGVFIAVCDDNLTAEYAAKRFRLKTAEDMAVTKERPPLPGAQGLATLLRSNVRNGAHPDHSRIIDAAANSMDNMRVVLEVIAAGNTDPERVVALASKVLAECVADLPQTVLGSKIDLARMRAAALHAQAQGYVFKADGSEVRQVIDLLYEKAREWDAHKAAAAPVPSAQEVRWHSIGQSAERACQELPLGYEIAIHLEKDAGTVTLIDPDGNEQQNFQHEEGLGGVITEAIEAAIEQEAQKGGAACNK